MRRSTRHDVPPTKIPPEVVEQLHDAIIGWFDREARDLPWRRDASPWAVMVSEFMLQQTPVSRVLPVYEAWIERWPTPTAMAKASTGDAVRAWGRLGYPRRALRLHAAATAMVADHGGEVPRSHEELMALPGVGEYTAAAVASFAYEQRHVVLDTNVRRVFARIVAGVQFPAPSLTAAERDAGHEPDAGPRRPSLGRRDDGARRPGLHSAHARVRRVSGRRSLPLASCGLSSI